MDVSESVFIQMVTHYHYVPPFLNSSSHYTPDVHHLLPCVFHYPIRLIKTQFMSTSIKYATVKINHAITHHIAIYLMYMVIIYNIIIYKAAIFQLNSSWHHPSQTQIQLWLLPVTMVVAGILIKCWYLYCNCWIQGVTSGYWMTN